MIRNRDREKLINSIVFFAKNTNYLGKIKLFKLLYLLDFEHFRATGRSVTGMEYRAWKNGPVPTELVQQWDALDDDLAAAFEIRQELVINFVRDNVVAKVPFLPDHFTKRELRLMQGLADQYRDTMSTDIIDVTHAENGAWDTVWNKGQGMNNPIPYELSIPADDPHREAVLESAAEYKAIAASRQL